MCVCVCSLEAKEHERVSAGLEPTRGVRTGPVLVWIHSLLPLLQAAARRTLQAAALQTSEFKSADWVLQRAVRLFSSAMPCLPLRKAVLTRAEEDITS